MNFPLIEENKISYKIHCLPYTIVPRFSSDFSKFKIENLWPKKQYLMGFTILNIIYIEYGACLPALEVRSAYLSAEE